MNHSTAPTPPRADLEPGPRGFRRNAIAAAVIAAVSVAAFNAPAVLGGTTPPASVTSLRNAAMPASFADMAERVRPAVVYISTKQAPANVAAPNVPPQLRDFMERYFHGGAGPEMKPTPRQGVGSGFLISADGYIVTNNHVVSGADEVSVTLSDGSELPARVRGIDPKTDLALLKIESEKALPFVEFGNSDQTRVGDWVVAVGSPFGLGGSFSAGIVSARGRDIRSGPYDDFIQTDASINQGNSGGPLFDTAGRVVGVNTAIFSPTGGNVGIGFAVPSSLAQPVLKQLKENGTVARGWLGVRIQDVTDELADGLGLPSPAGALIAEVEASSPAARAGLQVGDVVQSFNGAPIKSAGDLSRSVGARAPSDTVHIGVWRDGKNRDLEVALAPTPGDDVVASSEEAAGGSTDAGTGRIGVQAADLTPESRARLGLEKDASGAVIVAVQPGGPAAARDLRPGDVILRVGGTPVRDAKALAALVRDAGRQGDRVVLLVSRAGSQQFVPLTIARG